MKPWKETTDVNTIKFHMLNEGNNCSFLAKNICNVLIRWDTHFDADAFIIRNEKSKPADFKPIREIGQEIWS